MGRRPAPGISELGPHASAGMDTLMPRRTRRRATLSSAAALAATALLLTGCAAEVRSAGSDQSAPSATASTSMEPPASSPSTLGEAEVDMDALVAAWEEGSGKKCSFQDDDDDMGSYIERWVECDPDSALMLLEHGGDAKGLQESMVSEFTGDEVMNTFVADDRWMVFTNEDTATTMQAELGGELTSIHEYELAKPAEPIEVSSIEDLIGVWEDVTGKTCKEAPTSGMDFNQEGASCSDDAALAVYEDRAQLELQLEVVRALLKDVDIEAYRLHGEDWSVSEDMDILLELQEVLGGEIISLN